MATIKKFTEQSKMPRMRYFSEELKKRIVKNLENNITSVSEISREYEVSRTSLYNWIYQYSSYAKRGERVIVESQSETNKVTALKERIKELEQIIGQKQLLIDFKDKMIEIAEEEYKVDIKKKLGSKLSSGSGVIGPNTDIK